MANQPIGGAPAGQIVVTLGLRILRGLRNARSMRTIIITVVPWLLLACSRPLADSACPETPAPLPEAGVMLDAELRELASSAATLERLEFRLDESGAVIKQAVYHDARAALPEPVLAHAEREFPGGRVLHYESERYAELGPVHEIELETVDGRECELAGRADGSLLYTECAIDPSGLPEAVAAALAVAVPDAAVVKAKHKRVVGAEPRFIVELGASEGRSLVLQLSPEGAVLAKHWRMRAVVELPAGE